MLSGIELLRDFIARAEAVPGTGCVREWLCGDDMEVYVRRSVPRLLGNNQQLVTLDIANVTVFQKGIGTFTKFLDEAERINPWPAIYVESVQELKLYSFLLKRGYNKHQHTIPASFFKIKEHNESTQECCKLVQSGKAQSGKVQV